MTYAKTQALKALRKADRYLLDVIVDYEEDENLHDMSTMEDLRKELQYLITRMEEIDNYLLRPV